jgi:outer membrane protein
MKRNLIIIVCFCCSNLGNLRVFGQAGKALSTRPWTLKDCIEYAKANNIQLQALQKNTDLSEQDLLEAKAAMLPDLSASASQNFTRSTTDSLALGKLKGQPSAANNYSLGSQMVLYQGGYIKNQINSRKISIKQNQLNLAQAFNDVSH